jgi:hypothetical protein
MRSSWQREHTEQRATGGGLQTPMVRGTVLFLPTCALSIAQVLAGGNAGCHRNWPKLPAPGQLPRDASSDLKVEKVFFFEVSLS